MPKSDRTPLISATAYARHRGCSKSAVLKAIKTGRISLQDGKIDPVKADRDWAANTRPQARRVRRHSVGTPEKAADYHGARARRELAEAKLAELKLAELKLAEQEGRVIATAAVEQWWVSSVRNCRQRLLAIPSRLASTVIGVKSAAEAHALIEAAIYDALEELSRDDAPPALQP